MSHISNQKKKKKGKHILIKETCLKELLSVLVFRFLNGDPFA